MGIMQIGIVRQTDRPILAFRDRLVETKHSGKLPGATSAKRGARDQQPSVDTLIRFHCVGNFASDVMRQLFLAEYDRIQRGSALRAFSENSQRSLQDRPALPLPSRACANVIE